jgi:hypothetical protein
MGAAPLPSVPCRGVDQSRACPPRFRCGGTDAGHHARQENRGQPPYCGRPDQGAFFHISPPLVPGMVFPGGARTLFSDFSWLSVWARSGRTHTAHCIGLVVHSMPEVIFAPGDSGPGEPGRFPAKRVMTCPTAFICCRPRRQQCIRTATSCIDRNSCESGGRFCESRTARRRVQRARVSHACCRRLR